jgi:hypothetical protein
MSWSDNYLRQGPTELLDDDQLVLVKSRYNVGDEFDNGGFSFSTMKELRQQISVMQNANAEWYGRAGSFGNIEGPEINSVDEYLDMITIIPVTAEEEAVITKFLGSWYGMPVEIEIVSEGGEESDDTK